MPLLDPNSELILQKCHPLLGSVLRTVALHTPFGWRIVQGERSIAQQREYYRDGRSKVNPDAYSSREELYKAAKHITGPGMPLSRAVDVALTGGDPYHVPGLCFLAGMVRVCAREFNVKIRWGGDFDRDGRLLETGTFKDLPHFEIEE